MDNGRYLFISDLQCPYEHSQALEFCIYLKKNLNISDENCYCVGDETDQFWGGMWKKSPEMEHTPNSELKVARDKLRKWYIAFPKMKLAISNHGTRYWRKALEAEIPSQMMRRYEEVIASPPGWQWQKRWKIDTKYPMLVEHGDDWGGQYPHKIACLHNGCNTIMGHHHSLAGIEHIKTANQRMWGMVTGSLIDFEQYAFDYARSYKVKPLIGCGVVVDHGKTPIWYPLE